MEQIKKIMKEYLEECARINAEREQTRKELAEHMTQEFQCHYRRISFLQSNGTGEEIAEEIKAFKQRIADVQAKDDEILMSYDDSIRIVTNIYKTGLKMVRIDEALNDPKARIIINK